jgi:predicted RNA methylase
MNLFIHDPTKDTVSKQLFEASVLKDLDFAKVVKSFLDVFTDIDYVIDIGAHVGAITILSTLMGKKVITIDGEKDNLKLMCSTLSYLGLKLSSVEFLSVCLLKWVTFLLF